MIKKNTHGFTLIEIMIVLGILGAVLALSLNRIKKNDNNIKSTIRELSVLSKEIRNQARLTQSTFRLMIELSDNKYSYWVEKGNNVERRDTKLNIFEEYKKEQEEKDKEKNKPISSFQLFKKLTKKEKKLPSGISIKSVEVQNMEPITNGMAAIYYSSEGYVEASVIQIGDAKNTWSLVINPLTGFVEILEEAKTLKDLIR